MDYGVQLNKTMYQRLIKGGNISLFSPNEVPGLLEAFYSDQDEFDRLYAKYEADESIQRITVKAVDLFSILMQERASTGRIYIQNVDHCNTHSAFNPKYAPVTQSNLCVSGDTRILTSEGYKRMDENVGKKFTVWNGEEWSENVEIVKTNTDQKLLTVTLYQEGLPCLETYIDCTEYHKFYVYRDNEIVEVRANELRRGDRIERSNPNNYLGSIQWVVDEVLNCSGLHDTYCVTEPKRNKVVFNGVLTGNCAEIALPTKPMTSLDFSDGEIALCILSGVNMGVIEKPEDMEEPCELLVRALDAIIDYQEYPVKPAEYSCMKRRMLGIGVINHAYFLAKHRTRYSDEASKALTHTYFEALQYYCLKASVKLAKEYGPCELYHETTYAQGLLPIDTYKKDVDSICDIPYYFDWEALRSEIKEHGLRNSCLTSQFPSETSSQISNATNGIEPPRGYVSIKASKDGILKQVVPEYEKYGAEYELLWDMPSNKGYLENVAVMQKFMDQSISTNTNYDPKKYPDGKVPMKVLLQDLLMAYKLGVKTLYYQNTRDGADDKQGDLDDGCAGGGCKL
nr:MAG TPA: ribonucleotide-diphosphate reductase subunit alpha [Caudoviricetes sp.]